MDERIIKFRVGVMVLSTMLIVGILVILFGALPAFFNGAYTVYLWFPETPGAAAGTPVRKDGILIGRVTNVKLIDAGVVVTTTIDGKYKLRRSEVCRFTSTLLGDAVLQFVRGPGGRGDEFIQNGDYIEGVMAANPLQMLDSIQGDFVQAVGSISAAGRNVAELSDSVNHFFIRNDEQLNRIVGKTELALDNFQKAASDIDSLISDPQMREDLRKGLAGLPQLLNDTRDAVAAVRQATGLASENLEALQGLTKPLGERGPEIAQSVDESVNRLNQLLSQFVQFSKAINSRQGSLGRIVNDPELYQRLNAAAKQVECIANEVRKELRPILQNVEVITDKAARHPGVFIRDAVKPGPGMK